MNIGVVGCGHISWIYLKNLTTLFKNTKVVAVADIDETRANSIKESYGVPQVLSTDELLKSKEVDIVLNITTPQFHYSICKQALENGKHVYVEKPLSLTYKEAKELVEIAESKGLFIGGAPDTFLGAGIQTCKKIISDGIIGDPVGGVGFMMCRGHESWHASPEFYYKVGGGPLFDMGPYYITALVSLFGKVKSVFSFAKKTFSERTITSKPKFGQKIDVEVDTHVAGLLNFENGATVSLTTSFDVYSHTMPPIELYGSKGSIKVPDPNCFGGQVEVAIEGGAFNKVELISLYTENSRGIGLSEMVMAIEEGRLNNASGRLALHVVEVMESLIKSSNEGRVIEIESIPPTQTELDWNVSLGKLKTKK